MIFWYVIGFLLFGVSIWLATDLGGYLKKQMARREDLRRRREKVMTHRMGQAEWGRLQISDLLMVTQMPPAGFVALLIFSVILGFLVGKLLLEDWFLSCAMALAFLTLPVLYLKLRAGKKQVHEAIRLENALSIITNAYLSSGDIIQAVKDNLRLLEDRQPFEEFLMDVTLVDSNVTRALLRLASKRPNPFLHQWVDTVILSQEDRKMMFILPTIVQQMGDVRKDQMEAETAMVVIWRDYATMLLLVAAIPLVFRMVLYEWYAILVFTMVGRAFMLALMGAILYSLKKAMEINQPILF